MLGNALAVSAALALTAAPIAAQAAPRQVSRTGADVDQADQLRGTTGWIIGAIALGLIIWGIIELTDDDEGPESP